MKKDSYYFPHDSNAKDDPKCMLLIEQRGLEGYGTFWILIELLRDQPTYRFPLKLIPAIARKYKTSVKKMESVIRDYNLFKIENEEFFYSNSLINRMSEFNRVKESRSQAGQKGNEKRWGIKSQSDQSAIAEVSQSDKSAITEESQTIAKRDEESKKEKNTLDKSKEDESIKVKSLTPLGLFLIENRILTPHTSEFVKDEGWFDMKAKELSVDPFKLKNNVRKFLIHRRDLEKIEGRELNDFRAHFVSWFKKEQQFAIPEYIIPKI